MKLSDHASHSRRSFIRKLAAAGLAAPVAFHPLTGLSFRTVDNDRIKVLFDCDAGTDADDAVCLAYLLLEEKCDLLGVTTVGRESPTRAELVETIGRSLGRTDFPIAAGASHPLFSNLYWWHHHVVQAPVLEAFPASNNYQAGQAVELMKEIIELHPGEVTLLCVGPMTNAAALWAAYPDTFSQLKEMVVMGGRFKVKPDGTRTDCNFMLDPVASSAIYQRSGLSIRVAGADQTGPLSIPHNLMEEWFAKPAFHVTLECCRRWVYRNGKENSRMGLHDPFAASLIFRDDLCDYIRGQIGVRLMQYDVVRDTEIEGDEATGYTTFRPDDQGPHLIVTNAQKEKLHAHLASTWAKVDR